MKVLVVMVLVGCSVGPDYARPSAPVPTAYKAAAGWKSAQPHDGAGKGAWWKVFGSAELDGLEGQLVAANQSLIMAEAQLREARALARVAQAGYFPTVGLGAAATAVRRPSGLGFTGLGAGASNPGGNPATTAGGAFVVSSNYTIYSLEGDLSWELDLWGRVRRGVEAARANAAASAADVENARLSLCAQLAQSYWQLRALDTTKLLLQESVDAFARSLALTQERRASGVASIADVLQAQTQLESTRAQAIDVEVQRSQLEHAIAVLVGKPPADLSLPVVALAAAVPEVPVGLPSALLERRPDIAAAERRMAAANAQIGVATAAFFPALSLSASTGFESTALGTLLRWPSYFWSLGASATQILFQGGLLRAQREQARAAYDAAVASYRATVLTAFQEVEDNLAALRILAEEASVEERAVQAARATLTTVVAQYQAGVVSYLNVIAAQTAALASQRSAVDILGRRMTAAVQLIKALGGGFAGAQGGGSTHSLGESVEKVGDLAILW